MHFALFIFLAAGLIVAVMFIEREQDGNGPTPTPENNAAHRRNTEG